MTECVRMNYEPLIRELYEGWHWIPLESRNQANARKPEYLICNWEPNSITPQA